MVELAGLGADHQPWPLHRDARQLARRVEAAVLKAQSCVVDFNKLDRHGALRALLPRRVEQLEGRTFARPDAFLAVA